MLKSQANKAFQQPLVSAKTNRWPLLSSRIAFIMISTSAAIGLGNIWKFPYMVGVYGGSAFIFFYFISIMIIGIPTMIAEIFIGRTARQDPVNCFKSLSPNKNWAKRWKWGGSIALFTSFIAFSFYSVVAGWAIGYAGISLQGGFSQYDTQSIHSIWESLLASPERLIAFHTIFIIMTISINALGVLKGIESLAKVALPLLLLTLIGLVGVGAIYGDMAQTLKFMFDFRLTELSSEAMLSALGHAFFTLAVGAGAMMVYGSYMAEKQCIFRSVAIISLMDVVIALLAGLAIFPIVFAYQLTPEAGPGLMFQVLPVAFGQMPWGHAVGFLFFILLLFSAWTTAIAMVEPILSYVMKKTSLTRQQGSIWIGVLAWVLGLGSVFSFNIASNYKLFGQYTFFDVLTDMTSNILLPIGGLFVALFVGWGINRQIVESNLDTIPEYLLKAWFFILRYMTPAGIILIMLYSIF